MCHDFYLEEAVDDQYSVLKYDMSLQLTNQRNLTGENLDMAKKGKP